MPPIRLVVLVLVAVLAAAAALLLVDAGGGEAKYRGDDRAAADAAADPSDAQSATARREPDRADESTHREEAGERERRGTVTVQADEVDQCIDVRGSVVVVEDICDGREYRARVSESGAAVFEDVRVAPGEMTFRLHTDVPNRVCWPESFTVAREQWTADPPTFGISISLLHEHRLGGVVRDARTGRPIAGATVAVDSFAMSEATCDADGEYDLNLPEPRGTIIVTAPGYQESLWQFPEETPGGRWIPDRKDHELVRDPLTSWVDVVVEAADGAPAAGAELEVGLVRRAALPEEVLAEMAGATRRRFLDALEDDLDAFGPVIGADEPLIDHADEAGRARLRIAAPCRFELAARHSAGTAREVVEIGPGEEREVRLSLGPSASVQVTVTRQGDPVVGACVELFRLGTRRLEWTDDDGRAEVGGLAPGGGATLAVQDLVSSAGRRTVSVPSSGEVAKVEVELGAALVDVQGVVLDATSDGPILGATVAWIDATGGRVSQAGTSASGTFTLAAGDGGQIEAQYDGFRTMRVPRPPGDRVAPIRLIPIGAGTTTLAVDVVDAAGEPLDADVTATPVVVGPNGERSVLLFATGNRRDGIDLSLDLAARESATVDVSVRSRSAALHPFVVRNGAHDEQWIGAAAFRAFIVGAGEQRRETIRLMPPAAIRGAVYFGAAPIADAGVTWRSARAADTTRSQTNGAFELAVVAPGPGVLGVSTAFFGAVVELDVPSGGLDGVDVRLVALVPVPLRVEAAGGRLVAARVRTVLEDVDAASGVRVPRGASLTATISADRFRSETIRVSSAAADEGGVTVVLAPG